MPFRETLLNLAITCVLVLIVTLVAILLRQGRPVPKAIPIAAAKTTDAPATGPAVAPAAVAEFEVFPKARLIESKNNEADTLRIKPSADREETIFRLYFVDALETTLSSPQTVQEQARWFLTTQEKVLKSGAEATAYVTELLQKHPFMLYTRWEGVPNSSRYYAMIKVALKPGEYTHLADLLMRQGYAHVNGLKCELPDGVDNVDDYAIYLNDLGKKARAEKAGIWGR
jgi:endonuclease YncB( thermonuclease family)